QTPKKQNNLTKTKIQTIQQLHISTQTSQTPTTKPQKQANNTKPKQQKLTNPKFAQTGISSSIKQNAHLPRPHSAPNHHKRPSDTSASRSAARNRSHRVCVLLRYSALFRCQLRDCAFLCQQTEQKPDPAARSHNSSSVRLIPLTTRPEADS
ncbi:hypothetical protein SAMN04488518_106340, partial [Pseudovibrio ascidiaceicola]